MVFQTKTVSVGDPAAGSWSNGYVMTLTLTEHNADEKTNASDISYKLTLSDPNGKGLSTAGYSWEISIAGQKIPIVDFSFDFRRNETIRIIASGHLTVKHQPDGALWMPYAVSIPNVRESYADGPAAMELTGDWELTWIPRLPEISCPDGLVGETVWIKIKPLDEDLTYTLTYEFRELRGSIAENTRQTEIAWTIPQDFYSQMFSDRDGICVINCCAYSEGKEIGNSDYEVTVKVDLKASAPVISAEIVDCNPATVAVTGDATQLVRYCSNAQVTAVYQGKNGAGIEEYSMTNNGTLYTTRNVTIPNVESGVFRFYATDSRGCTGSLTVTKTVIPYIRPTCNLSDNKPDGEGNMTVKVSGNYFNNALGVSENTLAVAFRYKVAGGSYGDWVPMETALGVRSYTAQAELTGLDYQAAYVFQAKAVDLLCVAESAEYTVRAVPVFDWDENEFNVNGTLKVNNEAVADFVVSRGKISIWTWEKWQSGIVKCWGKTGEKAFPFTGDDAVCCGDTVYTYQYPFAITDIVSVSANIVSAGGVVPVVLSTGDDLQVSYLRLRGNGQEDTGYYTFALVGRWK